ncbi:MAG: copper resistance CopC family protein [Nocardioides sp.]|uniref:copper resistance CopC family protein n=1 Tax=Nocardioides sp. TaxID=35761 RepID=UPI003D6B4005
MSNPPDQQHPERTPFAFEDLPEDLEEYASAATKHRRRASPRGRLAISLSLAVLLATLVAVLLVASTDRADAHTDLTSSDPADGAALESAPDRLALTFTDDMSAEFSNLSLVINGTEPVRLDPTTDAGTVSAPVPDSGLSTSATGRTPATWSLAYRVVSADGHPVNGTITFTAPLPIPTQPPSERASESAGVDQDDERESPTEPTVQGEEQGDEQGDGKLGLVIAGAVLSLPLVAVLIAAAVARRRRRATSS